MANPYEIAIRISMSDGVSPVLAGIAREMFHLNMGVKELEGAFARVGSGLKYMVGGMAAMFVGGEIIRGMGRMADASKELVHQQSLLYRSTKDWYDVQKLTDQAFSDITTQVPTARASDVLRSYNELRSVLGAAEALTVLPQTLKMEALLENMTGQSAEGEGFKLWRALEMKGVTMSNPAEANRLADMMVQIIAGSGGKVNASTFQQLAGTAGAAWIDATKEALGPYAVMAADLGGQKAGTALMTLRQLLTGATTISRQQLDVFQQAGLIDMSKVKRIEGSNATEIAPGAITGSLAGQSNIFQWAQQIAPSLHALSEKIGLETKQDPAKVFDSLIAKIGRNRNAIKMLTMFTDPGFVEQIDKDLALWNQTMGREEAYNAMLGRPFMVQGPGGRVSEAESEDESAKAPGRADYQAVMAAFHAQWESMMSAIGGPVARALIPWMRGLTDFFTRMGDLANKHPQFAQTTTEIAGLTGVLLALGGAAAFVRGIFLLPGAKSLANLLIGGRGGGWPTLPS